MMADLKQLAKPKIKNNNHIYKLVSLSDDDYLSQLITYTHLYRKNDICSIKDTNSTYLAVTSAFTDLMCFNGITSIIGKSDKNMPSTISKFASTIYDQERAIEQSRVTMQTLDVFEYPSGFNALKSRKEPIINPTTSNVLGTFTSSNTLGSDSNLKTIIDIHHIKFGKYPSINITYNNSSSYKLTQTELNILFCICLGINNRKDIANFLSVIYKRTVGAETTIHDTFRRLYKKLNCNTPMQLLEFTIYNNLHLQIPQAFLPAGSYVLR